MNHPRRTLVLFRERVGLLFEFEALRGAICRKRRHKILRELEQNKRKILRLNSFWRYDFGKYYNKKKQRRAL